MLKRLNMPLYLIMLMVFSIACSSVSVASSKVMIHQQLDNQKTHCQHVKTSHAEHTSMSTHAQHVIAVSEPNCDVERQTTSHHVNCPDCSVMLCQAHLLGISAQLPQFDSPALLFGLASANFNYQAQWSSGYWQEILRPPKA